MRKFCEGLGEGRGDCTAPSLLEFAVNSNNLGPAGAEALAVALHRVGMPELHRLALNRNSIGSHGMASLALPLRKLPALRRLDLHNCEIGDEGVASLVADLGKDDFKALESLWLGYNKITDAGAAKLVAAIDAGGLPKLVDHHYFITNNAATAAAVKAVLDALAKRSQ